jgi:hypothetical protein
MVLIRVLINTNMTWGSDRHNESKTLYFAEGNNCSIHYSFSKGDKLVLCSAMHTA